MADMMLDWFFLPATAATVRMPFAFTNQTGQTVYVQTAHTGVGGGGLPIGWSDTVKNHGSLAHGSTLYAYHQSTRNIPTLTDGEATETTELRIKLYTDAGYTNLLTTLFETLNWVHYKSNDAAFTLVDANDFEVDNESWFESNSSLNTWGGNPAARASGKGYGSTYAIYHSLLGQENTSVRVLVGDGNLTTGQSYTLETRVWLDTKGLAISDVWHVFAGRHTLAGSNVGVALMVAATDSFSALSKKFAKPSPASKLYVSGVLRFDSATTLWYLDKVRWVKK